MRSNPELDAILAIFYGLVRDYPPELGGGEEYGVWTVGSPLKGTCLAYSALFKTTTFNTYHEKNLNLKLPSCPYIMTCPAKKVVTAKEHKFLSFLYK